MTTTRWLGTARLVVAAVVLVVLVAQVGADPFARAVDRITVASAVAALLITGVTTILSAWRWTWVARRLDLSLDLRSAVPAYYRSQLLNQVLPGGVLGDVDRAVSHGGDQAALGRAARAVVWERVLGQVGLVALALSAVVTLPSVLRGTATSLTLTGLGMTAAAALLFASVRRSRTKAIGAARRVMVADLRRLCAGRGPWLPLGLSIAAAAGHLLLLLVALRVSAADISLLRAVPLLLVVLVASSLPTNIAGWGPREGMAAWVFAAAGLGSAQGVTVAATYGILSLIAASPGVLMLVLDAVPRRIGVGRT